MKIDSIYERYKKDVYYFLYHLSHNKDISEDLTSEVFLQAIKSLPTFKGDSTIKTWLFGIARLKWFEFVRKEQRIKSLNEKLAFYINEIDFFCEDTISDKQTIDRILELLNIETEKSRRVVLMRVEGFSFYEIANELSVSENSARVIDFRTKKKIKHILTKEGYIDE
ncbi:MAG: RNA polymerase sigma factor [Eubacteriales bacterium]|uniref:RNA polymerase sigma factor n=1 Tax=Tannockella kyphosi TaxID=2899121 RepID=UPI0020115F66|nr:RNA polymerase sigma factor [Tannockella kyphosi]